jgi:hypothetical protein
LQSASWSTLLAGNGPRLAVSTHWGQDAIGIPIGRPTSTKASTSITGATLPANRLIGNRIPAHQASQ